MIELSEVTTLLLCIAKEPGFGRASGELLLLLRIADGLRNAYRKSIQVHAFIYH